MPRTITVSTDDELYDALASCKGGETILLEEGSYGKLYLTMKSGFDYDFPTTVTIGSADPDAPAVFTGVDVRAAANLALEGLVFDYTYAPGDTGATRPFNFTGCTNLTIRDCTFDGDTPEGKPVWEGGYGTATGLVVRSSTGTVLEGSEFRDFHRAVSMGDNVNTIVRGNEVHSIRMDGLTFSNMDKVRIEDNYIHDFYAKPNSGDHLDMIQFWTSGTTSPSTDIVIRGNVLDIGEGSFTQSIFMRNEMVDTGRAGTGMYYKNVLIEDNTIINAHCWGISVGEAAGLTIRNNAVLHADGDRPDGGDGAVEIPRINVAPRSTNVAITKNVTSDISGAQPSWTVRDNVFVQDQDPFKPNYYADVFVSSTLYSPDGRHQFLALDGSPIDRLDAGSSDIRTAPAGLAALIHVEDADVATRVFDASPSSLDNGALPSRTTFTWNFGDGTTARGATVSHSFTAGGEYDVSLTVRLPNGRTATETMSVALDGADVLALSPEGRFVASEDGVEIDLPPLDKFTPSGLQLGATGVAASVSRSHVVDVVGSDNMTIALTLDADRPGTSGEVFRFHGSFIASVTSAGELQFRMFQQDGPEIGVTGRGIRVNDGSEHDVVVQLGDGALQLWVDGRKLAEADVPGVVGGATGYGSHGLSFGNPWNKPNFNGDLSAFEISVGSADFPDRPKTLVLAREPAPEPLARMGTVTLAAEDWAADLAVDAVAAADEDRFEFPGAADQESFAA